MSRKASPRHGARFVLLRGLVAIVAALIMALVGPSWARMPAPVPHQSPPPKPKPPPPPGTRGPSVVVTVQVTGPSPVAFRNWLEAPMPNPIITSATIRYTCVRSQRVTIKLFDITGQKVATLLDQVQDPGAYNLWWDGRGNKGLRLASGVYFCRMETPGFTKIQKFVISR